jgi:hypothetical protein
MNFIQIALLFCFQVIKGKCCWIIFHVENIHASCLSSIIVLHHNVKGTPILFLFYLFCSNNLGNENHSIIHLTYIQVM